MPGGRPTKLTRNLHDQIVAAIRRGNYMEGAAALAGISKSTLYDWLRRGAREQVRVDGSDDLRIKVRKTEAPYVEFSHAVKKALAESEDSALSNIAEAGNGVTHTKTKTVVKTLDHGGVEVTETTETWTERHWQADAWRLERRFPQRWGRRALPPFPEDDGTPSSVAVTGAEETEEGIGYTDPWLPPSEESGEEDG